MGEPTASASVPPQPRASPQRPPVVEGGPHPSGRTGTRLDPSRQDTGAFEAFEPVLPGGHLLRPAVASPSVELRPIRRKRPALRGAFAF